MPATAFVAAVAYTPKQNPAAPWSWRVGPVVEVAARVPKMAHDTGPAPEPHVIEGEPVDGEPRWHVVKSNGKPGKRAFKHRHKAEAASVAAQLLARKGAGGAGVAVQAQPPPFASGNESSERRAWARAVKALERAGKVRSVRR